MKYRILCLGLIFIFIQACSDNQFEHEFDNIPEKGVAVPVLGKINIEQSGGHLQGIQWFKTGDNNYLFMSGSSSDVAFMVRAELDDKARVVSADTLMLDPYRHAGGFQIYDQYLAVGIEDNKLRNTSRVMVYDLEKGEDTWSDPLQTIHRDGEFERVTAGAVGIAEFNGQILIAVANWDSRNLDFYICPEDVFKNGENDFRLIGSLDMERISRSNWSDTTWYSYQNINLFTESGNQLYLAGFGVGENGSNVADLYKIHIEKEVIKNLSHLDDSDEIISIQKVISRKFKSIGNTSFRAGAGMVRNNNGQLSIFACPEHIDQSSSVGVYSRGGS